MFKIIFISVITPVVFIVVIGISMSFFVHFRNKKIQKLLDSTIAKVNVERETQINTVMNRIGSIAESNDNFLSLMNDLNIIYSDFKNNMSAAKKELASLLAFAKKNRFSLKNIKKRDSQLLKRVMQIDHIERKFYDFASQITSQDEMMRKEFTFYQNCLRQAVNLYNQKRILLIKIEPEIKKLNLQIKNYERQFESAIYKADITNANIYIRKYIVAAIKFINIVNHGPTVNAYLTTLIPNSVKKLVTVYNQTKKINIPLDHITFSSSIKKIAKDFNNANRHFTKLEISKTEESIKSILKGLKGIESLINLEVRSRNIFINIYEEIVKITKDVLNEWISSRSKIRDITSSGKTIFHELNDKYNLTKQSVKSLDTFALSLRKVMKTKSIPYSAKLQKARNIIDEINKLVIQINDLNSMIWTFNFESTITKQKFIRLESALDSIVAQINENKIKLSLEDKMNLEEIAEEKDKITTMINNDIDRSLKSKINRFSERVTDIYSLINGNIQIANHLKNILKEFSNQRSYDNQINLGLQVAERKYMEGKYTEGLNVAIETISERVKHG